MLENLQTNQQLMYQQNKYIHTYIHTYISKFIMCNTVKQSSNQRHGAQIIKYRYTIDQKLTDAAAYVPGRCRVCTDELAALFCMK